MESASNISVPESLAVSDSGFLFNASSGESFTLNPIGKEIFLLLKQGETLSAIKGQILEGYNIDAATFERDMEDFISQLKHYKLVTTK